MNRQTYSISPLFVFGSFWQQRSLVWEMTKRDVIGRYRGSAMGILWSLLNPILMLTVYTFVFSVVFRARWGTEDSSRIEFAIILFVGMIIHGLFAECVNRAPALVLSNVNYVKKVVFPLEILPWVAMGSALFHALISVLVLLAAIAVTRFSFDWTAFLLPLLLVPLVLLTMGITWFLASVGVFLRDVGQTTGIVTTIMLFLSPVFFPVSSLPEEYRVLLHLNPLTFMIEQARDVLVWGRPPDWQGLGIYFLASLAVAWLGLIWFQKTRRGFADVL
jgi:lipopolysaccharide transport system permease protein